MGNEHDTEYEGFIATELGGAALIDKISNNLISGEVSDVGVLFTVDVHEIEFARANGGFRLTRYAPIEDVTYYALPTLGNRLGETGIRFRFEVIVGGEPLGYWHHDWPIKEQTHG